MEFLKSCIRDIQGEKELMEATGISKVTDAWCNERNILPPVKLVDEVIRKLKVALDTQEVEQEISPEKIKQFYKKSAAITTERIASFQPLLISEVKKKEYESIMISGTLDLIKKEALAEEQGVSYIDFDSRAAAKLASKITSAFTEGLYSRIKNSYLFKTIELFQAIEKLKPEPSVYVLLNLGIHIPTINQISKITDLTETAFKGIPIIDVPFFDRGIIRSSLLLMKKESLPSFKFNDQNPAEIEKFALEQIETSISLFATVIDLTRQPQFKLLFSRIDDQTLDRSAMLKLALDMEIRWKESSAAVELRLYSDFYQEGVPNKLSEVRKL